MALQLEAINEFKELYRNDYGIVLTDEEATEKATLLFTALEVLIWGVPHIVRTYSEIMG